MRVVGTVVRRLRWARGWSITDLSEHSKVSCETIERIEAGRSNGSPKSAYRIAKALGVLVDDIVSEDDEEVMGAVGKAV